MREEGGGARELLDNDGEGREPDDEFDWPRECEREEAAKGAEGGWRGEYCLDIDMDVEVEFDCG